MSSIKVWVYCRTANSDEMALNNQRQQLIAYAQENHFEIGRNVLQLLDYQKQLKENSVENITMAGEKNSMFNFQFNNLPMTDNGRKFFLSWSHYLKLMRSDNVDERHFYEIESAKNDWSFAE